MKVFAVIVNDRKLFQKQGLNLKADELVKIEAKDQKKIYRDLLKEFIGT